MALAECCMSGEGLIGATLTLAPPPLFAETQSRIIVTVREGDLQSLLKLAKVKKCPAKAIGKVGGDRLKINDLVDLPVSELEKVWQTGFESSLFGG